jgi:hypothetical protein
MSDKNIFSLQNFTAELYFNEEQAYYGSKLIDALLHSNIFLVTFQRKFSLAVLLATGLDSIKDVSPFP